VDVVDLGRNLAVYAYPHIFLFRQPLIVRNVLYPTNKPYKEKCGNFRVPALTNICSAEGT